MTVPVNRTVELFDNIVAGVPIVCNWSLFFKTDVHVYFGLARDEAIQNVDFTVLLNAPSYTSFTVTPTTALLAKINALIALNPDETNYIEVRRTLPLTSTMSTATARSSENVAREFDQTAMRLQQQAEQLARTFYVTELNVPEDYDYYLPEWVPGRALSWHPTEKRLINSVQDVNNDPTSQALLARDQAVAAAASADADAIQVAADRAAVEAIAGSGVGLPAGGILGDILTKTGPNPTDRAWQAPSGSTAAATAAYADGGVPVDGDWIAGNNVGDNAGQKWTFLNLLRYIRNAIQPAGTLWIGLRSAIPAGYVASGGTIGNAGSGATTRANADCVDLFEVMWNLDILDTPIFTSAGAPSVRGASAAADFAALKRIQTPEIRAESLRFWDNGRGVDAARRLGSAQAEMIGPHGHPLAMNAMPDHSHVLTAHGVSRRGANGTNTGSNFYGSSGDSTSGGVASKATNAISAGTPTGTATNNTGTENRVRNVAFLGAYKL